MTTQHMLSGLSQRAKHNNTPWGNATHLHYKISTNASGILVNDALGTPLAPAAAIGIGDTIVLGKIQAGFLIEDALIIISDAFKAASTFDIGWIYADGVDVPATPQDTQYFAAALAADATSVTRKTGEKAPVWLPKDAYLLITNNTAAQDDVGIIDISVQGIDIGVAGGAPAYPGDWPAPGA